MRHLALKGQQVCELMHLQRPRIRAMSGSKAQRTLVLGVLVALQLVCLLSWPARGDLPLSYAPDGELLAATAAGQGVEVGVYGPRPARPGEPLSISVMIRGGQAVTVCSGFVVLAARRQAVDLEGAAPPGGFYIPFGQWSPGQELPAAESSQWRQLVALAPQGLWISDLALLTHPKFAGTPGMILDAAVVGLSQRLPTPEAARRYHGELERVAVAFLTDEAMTGGPGELGRAGGFQGAHAIRLIFPVLLKAEDTATVPASTFACWVGVQAHRSTPHVFTGTLSAMLEAALTPPEPPEPPESRPLDAPRITEPEEDALLKSTIAVKGQAKPGVLVVAWLEAHDLAEPAVVHTGPRAQYFAEAGGEFAIPLAVSVFGPPNALYELHVRMEAPGYTSRETVRRVRVQ